MRETPNLPPFANLNEERQVIHKDSYVDVQEEEEEYDKTETTILTNFMCDEDSKAFVFGYQVEQDKLHVRIGINFSKRMKKMCLGQDLFDQGTEEQIRTQTPNPLTRRELQVIGLYDQVELVTPVKQHFHKAFGRM